MFRAVLFDLDGTLVDSERESAEAMARVLSRDLGLPISDAHLDFVIGHSWNEIYARLNADFGAKLSWPLAELISRSSKERGLVIAEKGLTILPGAVETVRRLSVIPKAIVTGSSREEATQALRVLGLLGEFPVVLAAEDYSKGKPAPDGYLQAAGRLGVSPVECLVVEDSHAGITAGRAAGMKVVGVRAGNFSKQDQSDAHHVVDTLHDLTSDLLSALWSAA